MLKKLFFSSVVASTMGLAATHTMANSYATAIFDKTGSMRVTRPADGLTRCEYGKELFMQTVGTGIERADFLNVKTFGQSGEITSLSSGFVDVRGWNRYIGPGKALYDNIQTQLNSVSCNSGSTALGDALCSSMDELKSQSGATARRIGMVTDAGENASNVCGNPNGGPGTAYVEDHIIPRSIQPPPVTLNFSILAPGGNVSLRQLTESLEKEAQYEDYPSRPQSSSKTSSALLSDVDALVRAAEISGGGAIVIGDSAICSSNCDPESQNPPDWGGGW